MIYINHNSAIEQLKEIVDSSFNKTLNYMPNDFNKQQHNALELLKKRIFLEEIVEESIAFNRQLNWEETSKNLRLVNSVEELIEVFKLRSDIYTDLGYQSEFTDTIEGLNFDKFDKNAAILFYTGGSKITGTIRLIFDSKNKLPTESKVPFDNLRNQYNKIGELSRLVVRKETGGLTLEFKYLMQGVYRILMQNDIDITLLAIIKEHYKLYEKFGGTEIIKDMDDYGDLGYGTYLISLNPSLLSNFFKRTILR